MERMPEAEWGETPREWVTVMRARRAQSDTPEPDLCSCRHRESMDDQVCPHGWWLCGLFIWRCAPFSPGARRRLESCTPHVLSGQREQIPLCKRLSATQYPSGVGNRRRGICLFCRMPRLTAGPYPGWRCCRCRGPQTRRCNRPYGRRAPRNCRWRRADSPCRAGPAPRPGSRRRRCPHNP